MASPQERLQQLSSHLTFPRGLLAGQVAIITGAGQGIGAECARLFANEGAKVILADIDAEKCNAVAASINNSNPRATAHQPIALSFPGDLLDETYIPSLISAAADFSRSSQDPSTAEPRITCLINNAGFTWDAVLHKMSDKQFRTIMDVHALAPFRLVRALAPYFRRTDGIPRSIVNISSTSGLHGNAGQANYAIAKAGITGLTKTIAKEWGPKFGVRANTVAFGRIATRLTAAKEKGEFITVGGGEKVALGIPERQIKGATAAAKNGGKAEEEKQDQFKDIPLGRAGTATEAAMVILAAASPLFGYVTGETISVTGGRNI